MKLMGLAWRNLWRNPRRSVVTLAAMTLALLVMVLYTSLVEGMYRDLERDIVEVEIGDIQIHGEGYRERPSLYTVIARSDALVGALEARGYRVSPRRVGGGLVASGEASAGAQLVGVDVERDRSVSRVASEIAEGEWVAADDPSGVVLGSRLARALDAAVGSELIVLGQAADGSMANDLYRVRGVLRSVSEATDRAAVFMPRATFDRLFAFDLGAHQMIVRKPDDVPSADALAEVHALAAATSEGADTMSWQELQPTLATMVESIRALMLMVFLVIYLAIAILILNAMLMAVFERLKELGVLKAIGMPPSKILQLLFAEAGIQTACAVVLGLALAVPGLIYLSRRGVDVGALGGMSVAGMTMDSVWYSAITPFTFAGPIGILVAIVCLAVAYPGLKAARIRPVEAMRHQ